MLKYYALAFLCGAFTMTLELVASRLVAPVLGVSLYTWTSVIGAVLAGMSAGSFAGGWLADRRDPRAVLGPALIASSLAVALIVPALPALQLALPFLKTPLLKVALPILLVFGLPCFAVGLVSPIVYRICLQNPSMTGVTVGRLAACGSLGSIVGTFATGFWLIPAFGTRAIVLGVSGGLLVLGLLAARPNGTSRRTTAAALAVSVALSIAAWPSRPSGGERVIESAYYRIKVYATPHPVAGSLKTLVLDNLIHSAANPDMPDYLWYEYERVSTWVIMNWVPPATRALFLGGGGYTLPYWVERHYPQASIEVVEIDPEVTRIALSEFIVHPTRIVSINEDARTAVNALPADRKYDLIYCDAFNDLSVPYHLTTVQFDRLIRNHLSENGLYMANIVDTPDGEFLEAFTSTLARVFPNVRILAASGSAAHGLRSPHIVLASNSPIPVESWTPPDDIDFALDPRTPSGEGLVLTDDHAPVDNLLLPLFAAKLAR